MFHLHPNIRRAPAFQHAPIGDGSDEIAAILEDTQFPLDENGLVVRQFQTLTVAENVQVTTAEPAKALVLLVRKDCEINGEITMTAKGYSSIPEDCQGKGMWLSKKTPVPCLGLENVLAQWQMLGFPEEHYLLGGAPGGNGAHVCLYDKQTPPIVGESLPHSPGGGGGGARHTGNGGDGGTATLFGGGGGGGGAGYRMREQCVSHGNHANGTRGGHGSKTTSSQGSGGAGNPPGGRGDWGTTSYGQFGVGGNIWIVAGGSIRIGPNARISANGMNGGHSSNGPGGGSGGGTIHVLARKAFENNGTLQASGGLAGRRYDGAAPAANGGAGYICAQCI